MSENKWPPTPSKKYISLALVKELNSVCRDEYIGHILEGNVAEALHSRESITLEQILEPKEGKNELGLVLMEGAPGIGKSTLAWELCRNWDNFASMR